MGKKVKNIKIDIYTGHYWQAVLVKHHLEDRGIEVFLKNEKDVLQASIFKSLGSWDTITIVVSNLNYENAKVIVSEYVKKTLKGIFET